MNFALLSQIFKSKLYSIPLLGQIPIVQGIRECGDKGIPAAVSAGPVFDAFVEIAKGL